MPGIAVSEHVAHTARSVGIGLLLAIAVLLGVLALLGIPYLTDALSSRPMPADPSNGAGALPVERR